MKGKNNMAKSREGKRMIALEVDEGLYDSLVELTRDYGVGLSGVIRMVLIDYLKRYTGYLPGKEQK